MKVILDINFLCFAVQVHVAKLLPRKSFRRKSHKFVNVEQLIMNKQSNTPTVKFSIYF